MYRFILAAITLSLQTGCFGTPTQPSPDEAATDVPAAPEQAPQRSEVQLYAFEITMVDGTRRGTRVFEDGRIEVLSDAHAWTETHTLPPPAREALVQTLTPQAIASLPERLPVGPGAPANAPKASWTLRAGDETKSITAERYAGVRVPLVDKIEHILRATSQQQDITTRWRVQVADELVDVTVPCQPLKTRTLRLLAARILSQSHPETDNIVAEPSLLTIDWSDRGTQWSTIVTQDKRVVHRQANGQLVARQVDDTHWKLITQGIQDFSWSDAASECR